MLKINLFHFGYRFIVYVRVVTARCVTLMKPMLVKNLPTSSSIGRSLVSCYRNCIIILLNCHRDYAVYRLYVKTQQKKNMGCLMFQVKQIINMFLGLGKKSGGCRRWGRIFQVWKKISYITLQIYPYQLICKPHKLIPSNSSNPTNLYLQILQTPQTYTYNI
jgi:hypothetical protein